MSESIINKSLELIIKLNAEIVDNIMESDQDVKTFWIRKNILGWDIKRKYIKVFRDGGVVAFIDKNTGYIYKPASWNGPAKHPRGNVESENGGREAFTKVGQLGLVHVHYIR